MLDMSVASVNNAFSARGQPLQACCPHGAWTGRSPASRPPRSAKYCGATSTHRSEPTFSRSALLREDALRHAAPAGDLCRRATLIELWRPAIVGPQAFGEFRMIPTGANRQPAAATYVRRAGDDRYRPLAIDVLRIEDGLVAEVTTFGHRWFPRFGLPAEL